MSFCQASSTQGGHSQPVPLSRQTATLIMSENSQTKVTRWVSSIFADSERNAAYCSTEAVDYPFLASLATSVMSENSQTELWGFATAVCPLPLKERHLPPVSGLRQDKELSTLVTCDSQGGARGCEKRQEGVAGTP